MAEKPGTRFYDLLRDTRGVAGIEFAFLIPILIALSFGVFELTREVLVHKRVQKATDTVADLVAREQLLGNDVNASRAALDGVIRAARHTMFPYPTSPLKFGIMQLRANINNADNTTVEWSYNHNGKADVPSCPAKKDMPQKGMIGKGNAVILVESEYRYVPILPASLAPWINGFATFQDQMFYAPRNGTVDIKSPPTPGSCALTSPMIGQTPP